MFNATHFTYGGIYSGVYGLQIASFDGSGDTETTEAYSSSLVTYRPPQAKRFYAQGASVSDPPQHKFTILCEGVITAEQRRDILNWLCGNGSFRELKIHQADLEPYRYMCIFSTIESVYVAGRNVGFNVTATFNSEFARGDDVSKVVNGSKVLSLYVEPDAGGYVYPTVTFAPAGSESYGSLEIENQTEPGRSSTILKSVAAGETITMEGELKILSSESGWNPYETFNRVWLRLLPGFNTIKIETKGTVKITYPTYVRIGF